MTGSNAEARGEIEATVCNESGISECIPLLTGHLYSVYRRAVEVCSIDIEVLCAGNGAVFLIPETTGQCRVAALVAAFEAHAR